MLQLHEANSFLLWIDRIASNEPSFMSAFLKIQDQQHKQKLKLKALDVVLFGPPTRMYTLTNVMIFVSNT